MGMKNESGKRQQAVLALIVFLKEKASKKTKANQPIWRRQCGHAPNGEVTLPAVQSSNYFVHTLDMHANIQNLI